MKLTTELFKDEYLYKARIIGHIASKTTGVPQYIATSHGRIFNLVACSVVYDEYGREALVTGVKAYEMDLEELNDLLVQDDKFLYYIPFAIVPYEDTESFAKYKKICFDNFDIFKPSDMEQYFIRVNLCWEAIENDEFSARMLDKVS